MKAWKCSPINEYYCAVVFAETRNKAKVYAQGCDGFEDCEYIDIEARRLPIADKLYKEGKTEVDWNDPDDRIFLVKECGFYCEWHDEKWCNGCSAKEYCSVWEGVPYDE